MTELSNFSFKINISNKDLITSMPKLNVNQHRFRKYKMLHNNLYKNK